MSSKYLMLDFIRADTQIHISMYAQSAVNRILPLGAVQKQHLQSVGAETKAVE